MKKITLLLIAISLTACKADPHGLYKPSPTVNSNIAYNTPISHAIDPVSGVIATNNQLSNARLNYEFANADYTIVTGAN